MKVDAIVIGGGPAAATAALTLGRGGIRVALLYRTESRARQGEVLSSAARPMLWELDPGGILDKGMIRAVPGTKSRWGGAEAHERAAIFNPYGDDILLDRRVFDTGLLSLAAAETTVTPIALSGPLQIEKTKSGWRVSLDGCGNCQGSYVIDGSGRAAFMARRFGRRLILDRLICSCWELEGVDGLDRDERLIVASDRTAWWYSIRTGRSTRILGRVSETLLRRSGGWPDLPPVPAEILKAIDADRYRVSRWFALNASIEVSVDEPAHRWMAAGDAYATLDPLSGQGYLRAISDACAVATAVKRLLWDSVTMPMRS